MVEANCYRDPALQMSYTVQASHGVPGVSSLPAMHVTRVGGMLCSLPCILYMKEVYSIYHVEFHIRLLEKGQTTF